MSIAELTRVVKAPAKPNESGNDAAWASIQAAIGLKLPPDLGDVGKCYGTGRFYGGHIQIYNPFSREYSEIINSELDSLRTALDLGMEVPYAIHPDRPGLFPCGRDESGGSIFWFTEGDPKAWPLILRPHGDDDYERWDLPITAFLAGALSNKLKCILWLKPFSKKANEFSASRT